MGQLGGGRVRPFSTRVGWAAGSSTQNTLPLPSIESKVMSPPAAVTMAREMARPRPVPVPGALVVKNGSNTRGLAGSGMPQPESAMRISTRASAEVPMLTRMMFSWARPSSMAWMALTIRFISTCSRRTRSICTAGDWANSVSSRARWRISCEVSRSTASTTARTSTIDGSSGEGRLTCWISRTMLAMRPAPSIASSIRVGSSDWRRAGRPGAGGRSAAGWR